MLNVNYLQYILNTLLDLCIFAFRLVSHHLKVVFGISIFKVGFCIWCFVH